MAPAFSVVALVAAYNEADIIAQVVGDLIDQGILVYFLDDGSTDGTVAAVQPFVGRGVLAVERRAVAATGDPPAAFEWERILLRKTQLARELDADWFIHHDADEFRESPWPHLTLKDAIQRVDALGFNAIDFASLDFWPVHDAFRAGDDVRQAFPFYAERAPYDRLQIRSWKKTHDLDLASTGGHEAQFHDRKVFPLRFILRHYPIRGQAHGERKVFEERRSRFLAHERARGWHVQYDETPEGGSFIRDPSSLTPYDPEAVRVALMLRHRGVEALEASLAEARSAAEAQRGEIERRDAELERRSAEIERRGAEIERRGAEIARTQGELTASDADAATVRDELARHAAWSAEVRAQLEARTAELEARNAQIDAQSVELGSRNAQVHAQRVELDALGHELHARSEELRARGVELDARNADVAALRNVLDERAADIGRLRDTVNERTRLVDELHRSLSWRWTSPLRAIARLLRR